MDYNNIQICKECPSDGSWTAWKIITPKVSSRIRMTGREWDEWTQREVEVLVQRMHDHIKGDYVLRFDEVRWGILRVYSNEHDLPTGKLYDKGRILDEAQQAVLWIHVRKLSPAMPAIDALKIAFGI
jgi:hypothetical protein